MANSMQFMKPGESDEEHICTVLGMQILNFSPPKIVYIENPLADPEDQDKDDTMPAVFGIDYKGNIMTGLLSFQPFGLKEVREKVGTVPQLPQVPAF